MLPIRLVDNGRDIAFRYLHLPIIHQNQMWVIFSLLTDFLILHI